MNLMRSGCKKIVLLKLQLLIDRIQSQRNALRRDCILSKIFILSSSSDYSRYNPEFFQILLQTE